MLDIAQEFANSDPCMGILKRGHLGIWCEAANLAIAMSKRFGRIGHGIAVDFDDTIYQIDDPVLGDSRRRVQAAFLVSIILVQTSQIHYSFPSPKPPREMGRMGRT